MNRIHQKMTSRQIAKKVEQDMNDVFDSIKEALESLTEEEALQTLSDFFGIDFKDMDEAMVLVEENNENYDGRVWVNKYQLVD